MKKIDLYLKEFFGGANYCEDCACKESIRRPNKVLITNIDLVKNAIKNLECDCACRDSIRTPECSCVVEQPSSEVFIPKSFSSEVVFED